LFKRHGKARGVFRFLLKTIDISVCKCYNANDSYFNFRGDIVLNIGNNRECFFDDYLVDTEQTTAEQVIHHPVRRGAVMHHDEPWEGNCSDYHNFIYDNGIWRMYYLGWWYGYGKNTDIHLCYAESRDGIHWEKPHLGLCEFNGTKNNNIIFNKESFGQTMDNFAVFRDDNPECQPDKKYKAVARADRDNSPCLVAFYSPDGIHWTKGNEITRKGVFDSLNVAFWDAVNKKYRCYFRNFHAVGETTPESLPTETAVRDICYTESTDFVNWGEPVRLNYGDSEDVQLYTNVVQPYYRAPQILVGLPSRYICRPQWNGSFDELCGKDARLERIKENPRYGLTITDCVFMASRNGVDFKRYDEAFIRPEPEEPYGWVYGTAYPAWGMIETQSDMPGADPEISLYVFENHWSDKPADFVRYTIRCDGFVSMHAGAKEKLLVTKPFIFDGDELRINFATSARGYLKITLEAENGTAIESCETFGNSIDRRVHFDGDVSALAGKNVTMKVRMLDADLYSIRFCKA